MTRSHVAVEDGGQVQATDVPTSRQAANEPEGLLDMDDEAARLAAAAVEEVPDTQEPVYSSQRMSEILAMPNLTSTKNKRKRGKGYAAHSRIMTSATWIAEKQAEDRAQEEKVATIAARKEAAPVKKAVAAGAKAAKALAASQAKAAKALWDVQEKRLRRLLWPAKGAEEDPKRLWLLSTLVPIQGCSRDPAVAKAARQQRIVAQRNKRLQQFSKVAAAAAVQPMAAQNT